MEFSKSRLMILGVLLAFLGIAGLAVPVFITHQTKDVAEIGDLKLQTQEDSSHVIPPLAAGGVLALGLVLVLGGFYRKS